MARSRPIRAWSWKTVAVRRRASRRTAASLRRPSPPIETAPLAAPSRPFSAQISVVLPTPEGPTIAVTAPSSKASDRSRRTSRSPRRIVSRSTLTAAPVAGAQHFAGALKRCVATLLVIACAMRQGQIERARSRHCGSRSAPASSGVIVGGLRRLPKMQWRALNLASRARTRRNRLSFMTTHLYYLNVLDTK